MPSAAILVVLIALGLVFESIRSRPPASSVASDEIVVVSVGDTLLGDASARTLKQEGWDYPFRQVATLIDRADLLIGNLEGPITERSQPLMPDKRWSYRQELATAEQYANVGFDVFDLANNHSMDYGAEGLQDTIDALDAVGIQSFGAGANAERANAGVVIEIAGVRIGLIGWMRPDRKLASAGAFATADSPGVAQWEESEVRASLKRLRAECDILIANVHWGENYKPVSAKQLTMGRQMIEWGADVVNGHHPHIAQGVEVYRGRPIVYSVGNFVFGTLGRFEEYSVPGFGAVAAYVIDDRGVSRVELRLIDVDNRRVRYQPTPVGRMDAEPVLEALMEPFHTAFRWHGDVAVIDLPEVIDRNGSDGPSEEPVLNEQDRGVAEGSEVMDAADESSDELVIPKRRQP